VVVGSVGAVMAVVTAVAGATEEGTVAEGVEVLVV